MTGIPKVPISRELLAAKAQPYKDLKSSAKLLLVRIQHLLIFVEKDDFIHLIHTEFQLAYDYTYMSDMRPLYNINCFLSEDCDILDQYIMYIETGLEKTRELIRKLSKADPIVVNPIKKSLESVEKDLKEILKMVGPRLRQMGA